MLFYSFSSVFYFVSIFCFFLYCFCVCGSDLFDCIGVVVRIVFYCFWLYWRCGSDLLLFSIVFECIGVVVRICLIGLGLASDCCVFVFD